MIKKMIWMFSWILFVFGIFFAVVVFAENGGHRHDDLLVCLAALSPRLLLSAFYLAEDVWTFSIFGLIAPIIVIAGVFWTANLAFPENLSLITIIESAVFIAAFFAGLINHRRWLKSWAENAQNVLKETNSANRRLREV
jgi:hypothetical protein